MSKEKTEEKKVRGRAVVRPCTCTHAQQDAIHGVGRRVHNTTKDGYRCTVCGK